MHAEHLAQYFVHGKHSNLALLIVTIIIFFLHLLHGYRNMQKWKGFPVIHCGPPAFGTKNRSCCFRSKSKGKNKTIPDVSVNDISI